MVANTDYRGTLTLQNTGGGVSVSYTLRDAATGGVVMTFSATQPAASFTQFDTAAFYLSKTASSANYNFIIKAVDVSLAGANGRSAGGHYATCFAKVRPRERDVHRGR